MFNQWVVLIMIYDQPLTVSDGLNLHNIMIMWSFLKVILITQYEEYVNCKQTYHT